MPTDSSLSAIQISKQCRPVFFIYNSRSIFFIFPYHLWSIPACFKLIIPRRIRRIRDPLPCKPVFSGRRISLYDNPHIKRMHKNFKSYRAFIRYNCPWRLRIINIRTHVTLQNATARLHQKMSDHKTGTIEQYIPVSCLRYGTMIVNIAPAHLKTHRITIFLIHDIRA